MHKYLRALGFNWTYLAKVTTDPVQVEGGWKYQIQPHGKILCWLKFKIYRFKISTEELNQELKNIQFYESSSN